MAIKLADTLAPMADFPAAMAEHIEFDDGESLQEKLDSGSLGATASDIIVAHTPDEADALQKKVNRNKLMFYMGNTKSSYVHGELYYLHWNAITLKKFYTKGGGILEIDYDVLEQKYASYSQTITFNAKYKEDPSNAMNRWFCEYSGGSGSRLDVVGVNIANGSATLGDVIEFTYNSASKNSDNYTWKPLFVKPQRTFEKNWWLVNKIATYGGGYDNEFINGHRYQFTADVTINATASGNIVVSLDEEQYKNYFGLHSKSSFIYNANTGCFEYRYGAIGYEDNRFTIEYLNKAGITWTGEIANGDTITVTCTMSDDINDYYWKDLDAEGGDYTQLTQSEYDALEDSIKLNGKEYRTYDTGHIYRLGVEFGKDASADDIVSFAKPSQLGLDDASCTVVDLINAMFLEQRKDYSKRLIGIFPYVKNESNITDLPTDISSKGQVEICTSGWDMASAKFTDTANCVEYIGRTIVASGVVNSISWKKVATTITSLSELGLTADATFQDVIDALPKGGSALLGVTEFTNYQTIFPYEEGNDQFARVYIVKGAADGSRMYARWFRKDGIKEAIAKFNINDNKFDGWRMLKDSQTYTSLKELGLDTTATINDIIDAMKDGSQITYKTDVFDYATEYNNIQLGTVVIHKQSASRVQALMTDKDTGNLYVGRLDGNNKVIGWRKIITEVSDPYSCTKYTALTGTEDLFTLPCGHYVSANINTTYNYPITDTNTTAHIYILGHLNDPVNNKGYRIILYFDNKGRMYRINEWWGVFTDNGWQEVAYRTYTTLAELGLEADATVENVIKALPIGGRAIISTHEFTNYQTLFPYSAEEDKYATLKVEKGYDNTGSRTIVTWVRKDASKIAYGGLDATNAVRWWNEYATKSYVDSKTGGIDVAQTDITINTYWATQETRADCPTNKYVVKNGICYLSATFTTLADKNYTSVVADLATGLPKPAIGCFANVTSGSNKNALVYIHNDGVLKGSSLSTNTLYDVSLTYPVAE